MNLQTNIKTFENFIYKIAYLPTYQHLQTLTLLQTKKKKILNYTNN